MDLGQTRRGVDMGTSAIRYAGITEKLESLHFQVNDLGDVDIPRPSRQKVNREDNLRNLNEVVEANTNLAQLVNEEVKKGHFPLVLGGDHSIAIGSIAGVTNHYTNLGVIWYDAHGDINTVETSPSGNIHGMPLAVSLGLGHSKLTTILNKQPKVKPENIVLIGIRDLDAGERQLIKDLNLKIYTMHEIDRIGMPKVMEETINYLKNRTDGVHLSFDLDVIDPLEAPWVGTSVICGATYCESNLSMVMLSESDVITSAD